MLYKKSKFNFIYEKSPDEYVIYNTYSKAVILLDCNEFKQYETLKFEDPEIEEKMVDNGILVEESFDEIGFLSYCHYRTKFSHGALHLVLATTMDCNFGCPYCYENRRAGKMSD